MEYLVNIFSWMGENALTIAILVGGVVYLYYNLNKGSRKSLKRPQDAVMVGKVTQCIVYPVKSIRSLEKRGGVLVDHMGVKTNDGNCIRDRSWMFALESGTLMTHRAEPTMALIQPSILEDGNLQLDAPDMEPLVLSTKLTQHNSPTLNVNVFGMKGPAVHCGEKAAEWLCKYLGKKGFIMAYYPSTMIGRKIIDGSQEFHNAFRDEDRVAFADTAPVHLITQATVDDVVKRVGSSDVTVKNFRPNILLEGPEAAYNEDGWDKVYIGDSLVLENRLLAPRCIGTTISPDKGIKDPEKEPIKTMKGYRTKIGNDPCLGLFLSVLQEGEVKVGDTVYATRGGVRDVSSCPPE